jgi:hypothetical protein
MATGPITLEGHHVRLEPAHDRRAQHQVAAGAGAHQRHRGRNHTAHRDHRPHPDLHRPAVCQSCPALCGAQWVRCRIDLHGGPDQHA